MARQADRRQATRAALIAAARACFAEQGFDASSTDAVLARAGVSKGALYHHFASKADLLAAVFEGVATETMERAQKAARTAPTPRAALAAACRAWLRAALAPEPRTILLETGPAILGHARARAIEEAITQAPMRRTIAALVDQGDARVPDIDLAARLLDAALAEMALAAHQRGLAGAGPAQPDLTAFDAAIDTLVEALVPPA